MCPWVPITHLSSVYCACRCLCIVCVASVCLSSIHQTAIQPGAEVASQGAPLPAPCLSPAPASLTPRAVCSSQTPVSRAASAQTWSWGSPGELGVHAAALSLGNVHSWGAERGLVDSGTAASVAGGRARALTRPREPLPAWRGQCREGRAGRAACSAAVRLGQRCTSAAVRGGQTQVKPEPQGARSTPVLTPLPRAAPLSLPVSSSLQGPASLRREIPETQQLTNPHTLPRAGHQIKGGGHHGGSETCRLEPGGAGDLSPPPLGTRQSGGLPPGAQGAPLGPAGPPWLVAGLTALRRCPPGVCVRGKQVL